LIGVIVLSAVVVVMLGVFLWFYLYSRTPAWGQSDTRKAMLNMMIVVGPIFGMHYKKEPPEPTSISAPAQDDEDDKPAVIMPPSESE
jgi:drug/metabolite transporter (DMT)-like permease